MNSTGPRTSKHRISSQCKRMLLVVVGFLGTGKTTFITNLARTAMGNGLRVAVIVNEIGETGIDDQFIRRQGFSVLEILGGCICCTLTANLIQSLHKVHETFSPDIIIVEPSGAADPASLFDVLDANRGDLIGRPQKIALLDPLRMEMLMEVVEPLMTSTLKQTDLIFINKADIASSEQIELARRVAADKNPMADIRVISAKKDIGATILPEILSWRK